MTKFNANDRLVKDVDEQIANTVAALNHTTATHEVSSDVDPQWLAARHDLSANRVSLIGLRARRASLAAQIASLQSDLSKVELQSAAYEALEQRVVELENGYKAYAQKRENSLVSDLMDEQKWLNVAVVQYPTLNLTPSRPRPITDIPLGALTALLFAGCTVFAFEGVRQQVSTPAELEAISRYPVLATVPYAPLVGKLEVHHEASTERSNRLPPDPDRKRLVTSSVQVQ
jgi:uncharacterized protein involved in exopolysaccharide biosynthesis